jgi:hypothetical protein
MSPTLPHVVEQAVDRCSQLVQPRAQPLRPLIEIVADIRGRIGGTNRSVQADREHRQSIERHCRTLGRGGRMGGLDQRGIDGGIDALDQAVSFKIEAIDGPFGTGDGGVVYARFPSDVLELPLFQVRAEELQ